MVFVDTTKSRTDIFRFRSKLTILETVPCISTCGGKSSSGKSRGCSQQKAALIPAANTTLSATATAPAAHLLGLSFFLRTGFLFRRLLFQVGLLLCLGLRIFSGGVGEGGGKQNHSPAQTAQ